MTKIATNLPEDLSLRAGDKVHLEAEVQNNESFMVTRVVHQKMPGTLIRSHMSLTDWVKKYAGTMKLAEGETRESLRDAYLSEKFGN
jgi:hypothetical protein